MTVETRLDALDQLVDSLAHVYEQLTAAEPVVAAMDDRHLSRAFSGLHRAVEAAGSRAMTLRHREQLHPRWMR